MVPPALGQRMAGAGRLGRFLGPPKLIIRSLLMRNIAKDQHSSGEFAIEVNRRRRIRDGKAASIAAKEDIIQAGKRFADARGRIGS